jgi:pyruvate dehydrogenase E2 component (dihydrolipoamide acetyltransferase)
MSQTEIKVPNIGDFKDVEVIEVLVKEGDEVKKNDPLITIESDKSSVEIPSTVDGKIIKLNLKIGDKVSEGDNILQIEKNSKSNEKPSKNIEVKKEEKGSQKQIKEIQPSSIVEINTEGGIALASPKTRKFARELGVNINLIKGSQLKGRVDETDVKNFISSGNNSLHFEDKKNKKLEIEFQHDEFGSIEVKDIPRVKKLASTYLSNSWSNIPHVTNHDEADITELENFRSSLTDIYTGEKKKITPLAFIVKALTASLKKFPNFNSSIDEIENGKMTLKKYFHIGIAVDTKHGLMVPKLRNANNKSISNIAKELKNLSELCKNLKIDKKELFGGSMTITSLGGIGGSFFTPIINYPEVAILGIGKAEKKQKFINGKFETRTILPISLSYDHRIIDGAEAARFNNDLKENLGKNFAYKLAV